jgi:RNA polymerase sigma-70 factor, ECF subfamily
VQRHGSETAEGDGFRGKFRDGSETSRCFARASASAWAFASINWYSLVISLKSFRTIGWPHSAAGVPLSISSRGLRHTQRGPLLPYTDRERGSRKTLTGNLCGLNEFTRFFLGWRELPQGIRPRRAQRARTGMKARPHEIQKEQNLQWAALLRRLQATHDERVLKEILAQTGEFVFAVAYHYTRNYMLADDARQTVFVSFAKGYAKIRDPMKLRHWLGRTAKHSAWALVRPKKSDDPHWKEIFSQQDAPPTPLELLIQEDSRLAFEKALRKALRKLPLRYRRCLYLRFVIRLDPSQVAEAMVIAIEAVYEYTTRGLRLLAREPAFKELHDEMSK